MHYPTHEAISAAIHNIISFHPSLPKHIKKFILDNIDTPYEHNRECMDYMLEELSLWCDEMNFNGEDLLRDIASYIITLPDTSDYDNLGML